MALNDGCSTVLGQFEDSLASTALTNRILRSAEGAKEPEPTAQAVGFTRSPNRAPEGRNMLYQKAVSPLRGSRYFLFGPTACAVGSGSFAPAALFGTGFRALRRTVLMRRIRNRLVR